MNCSLHDIERVTCTKPGGLESITLIVPEEVDSIPEQYCVPNIGDITLMVGATSYQFYFKRNSARLVDKQDSSNRAGDTFEYTLTFSANEIRLSVEWLRAKLANRRIHVIAKYRTGLERFIQRMRVRSESDSGGQIREQGVYNFSLRSVLSKPAPTLNSSLTGTGSGVSDPTDPPGLTIGKVITAPGGTVDIPEERLIHAIVITPAVTDNTVKIGTTSGGEEIMSSEVIPAGENLNLNTAYYYASAGTLYVAASENCSVIVYLR